MVYYTCEVCFFQSRQKNDFKRHLNTLKHKQNVGELCSEDEKNLKNLKKPKKNLKIEEMNQNEPPMNQNEPAMNQNEPSTLMRNDVADTIEGNEMLITNNETINEMNQSNNCQYCGKYFNTIPSKRRHELHRCKHNPNIYEVKYRNSEREKKKLHKYIDKLLDNVTTPTVYNIENINNQSNNQTNTQNINLNNYGQEDTSHITDKMLMSMIKVPYNSIQKMIEYVHFNKKKPENRNIAITNKKEKMIKVFEDNKWKYKDRDDIIDELIQTNYGRVDDYYENTGNQKLEITHNKRYKKYQGLIDKQDERLMSNIKKDINMMILSENL